VYDVVTGKDTFAKTTREIAEYVGREFDDAGEFRTGMVEMSLPPIVEPAAPEDGSPINFELWKMARRTFEKQTEARRRNSSRVYALVIGQCSQALRNRIEAHERWGRVNEQSDVMELLQLIQTCMIQRQTRQKPTHSLLDAETQVYAFKQRSLANNEYYEKFKDLVMNADRLGSDIGAHFDRVDSILNEIADDPNMPTDVERERARERAKDQFLAVMFLVNSDRARYGSLIRDVENEYTRGTDTYPTTLSAAYDYLVNYRGANRTPHDPDDSGLSYYTEDNDGSGRGRGRNGRGGGRGGAGRGRGRRGGGRGRGADDNQDNGADEDALHLVDKT
jgi:type II secretory pathway pseudopilin PulG